MSGLRRFNSLIVLGICLIACPGHDCVGGDELPPARPEHKARVVIERQDRDPLVLTVHGERVREDGRLRFVGSVDRPDGGLLVRWDMLCDPNPNGSASIEGTYQLVGPFDGSIRFQLPLNPIVDGPVAFKSEATMRANADRRGVAVSVPRDEYAWSAVLDGRAIIRHGRGPLSIERGSAGVTKAREWSSGVVPGDEPLIVSEAQDRLSIRAACTLSEGASAIFQGRILMVGDPANFRFREPEATEEEASPIPRRDGSISISVPGTGSRGRREVRPNKPPAVVRPGKPRAATADD